MGMVSIPGRRIFIGIIVIGFGECCILLWPLSRHVTSRRVTLSLSTLRILGRVFFFCSDQHQPGECPDLPVVVVVRAVAVYCMTTRGQTESVYFSATTVTIQRGQRDPTTLVAGLWPVDTTATTVRVADGVVSTYTVSY